MWFGFYSFAIWCFLTWGHKRGSLLRLFREKVSPCITPQSRKGAGSVDPAALSGGSRLQTSIHCYEEIRTLLVLIRLGYKNGFSWWSSIIWNLGVDTEMQLLRPQSWTTESLSGSGWVCWSSAWGFGSKLKAGTFLVVQSSRLCAPNAEGRGTIPGQGARSHKLQRKILRAATKTQPMQPRNKLIKKDTVQISLSLWHTNHSPWTSEA